MCFIVLLLVYFAVVIYIYREVSLLTNCEYGKLMSALISVVNDIMIKLTKQQENGLFYDGKIHQYPLIRIQRSDWKMLKLTREKVNRLLWSHECLSLGNNTTGYCRFIDPISLILIHRNARHMIKKMLPVVCFYYPCTYTML